MSQLRIVGAAIELDGVTIATLVPGLRLSLRDQLISVFEALDEDYVVELEARVEQLEAWLKEPAR